MLSVLTTLLSLKFTQCTAYFKRLNAYTIYSILLNDGLVIACIILKYALRHYGQTLKCTSFISGQLKKYGVREASMAEKRDHQRINCAEKCLLYHEDSKYCGAIMNISISGALVALNDSVRSKITPGDTCSFILSNELSSSFCRYKIRITRVSPAGVGFKILEHTF